MTDKTTYQMLEPVIERFSEKLTTLPKLTCTHLWHVGWWDGPTSGVVLCNGKPCWYQQVDQNPEAYDDEDTWYRRYIVVELTEEQFQALLHRYRWFSASVLGKRVDYCHNTNSIIETDSQEFDGRPFQYGLTDVTFDPESVRVVGVYER